MQKGGLELDCYGVEFRLLLGLFLTLILSTLTLTTPIGTIPKEKDEEWLERDRDWNSNSIGCPEIRFLEWGRRND